MLKGSCAAVALCAACLTVHGCAKGGGPSPVMAIRRLSNLKVDAANSSIDQGQVLDLETSLDRTIVVGEEFKVALESNSGTGYQWQCDLGNDPCIQVDASPEIAPVDTGVVGGRVRTIFVLHGKSVGKAKVPFSLARPWEKNQAPSKAVTLTLTVNAAVDANPAKDADTAAIK